MLVCEEINFELPPKIIVLNPKDGKKSFQQDCCKSKSNSTCEKTCKIFKNAEKSRTAKESGY